MSCTLVSFFPSSFFFLLSLLLPLLVVFHFTHAQSHLLFSYLSDTHSPTHPPTHPHTHTHFFPSFPTARPSLTFFRSEASARHRRCGPLQAAARRHPWASPAHAPAACASLSHAPSPSVFTYTGAVSSDDIPLLSCTHTNHTHTHNLHTHPQITHTHTHTLSLSPAALPSFNSSLSLSPICAFPLGSSVRADHTLPGAPLSFFSQQGRLCVCVCAREESASEKKTHTKRKRRMRTGVKCQWTAETFAHLSASTATLPQPLRGTHTRTHTHTHTVTQPQRPRVCRSEARKEDGRLMIGLSSIVVRLSIAVDRTSLF